MPSKVKRFHVERNAVEGNVDIIDGTITTAKYQDGSITSAKFAAYSKYKQGSTAAAVGIGVSGSPATILTVGVDSGYYNALPLTIKATPSGLGTAETATFHVVATLDDGTTATLASKTTAAGSTATETITIADCDFSQVPAGRRITSIKVTAESSATSTTATATATIAMLEQYC